MILLVNVVNEVIKVIRRLIVEDAATQAEKNARQRAALSLLMAPLSYFRGHMTGNIHGRLNRSLEGTVKLIKLLFMDFAPAVSTGLVAIVTIFWQLPFPVACLVILVIPVGTFIVFRQISTQKGIRVELMDTKADMDGTMVELLGALKPSARWTVPGPRVPASKHSPSSCAARKCATTRPWPCMTA